MAGIGRIENKLKSKLEATDKNISAAFQDLSQLIGLAQQMTKLSKSIAAKIQEHGAQVTTDETIQFKSHLLELGIEQQIDSGLSSKSSYPSSLKYYEDLARQIASIVRPVMERNKQDQLTLSAVYCCFNRARGMDLVSPDDILKACKRLDGMAELGLKLSQYNSGLLVIQNQTCDSDSILIKTVELVQQADTASGDTFGGLTALGLASRLSISVQLARQRLLDAEAQGKLCRDESVEGLKFYPNKFITGL